MKENYKLLFIATVFVLLGFGIGAMWGVQKGVRLAIDIGIDYLDIDIDREMLAQGMIQYKEQLGGCAFIRKNASIYDYSRGEA